MNTSGGSTERRGILRLWPLLLLVAAAVLAHLTGLTGWLDLEVLRERRADLEAMVAAHPVLAPVVFVLIYTTATALSLPGGAILTIAGGFLFGTALGALLALTGATAGAVAVFLIARTSLGEPLRARAGARMEKMARAFNRNGFSYLLVLRLVPVFPFWLVNLVPAFLGMPLRTYFLATLIGILPGCLVYASVGGGLGAVLDAGGSPDLGLLLEPAILLPILGLAALSLLPVAWRRWRGEPDAVGEPPA